MELQKEHTKLIEKLVKANPKYNGNEDLFEDFCSETCQKSYLILQSVEDMVSLESYLKKVVSSAIIDVLKNSGRLTRNTKGYSNIKVISINETPKQNVTQTNEQPDSDEITLDETDTLEITNEFIAEEIQPIQEDSDFDSEKQYAEKEFYLNQPPILSEDLQYIQDPKESLEEQVIKKDILENIIKLVNQINDEKPQEMYLKIFYYRYFLQKKQKEIAQDVGISQAEVSKRLVQLSRLIKEKLDKYYAMPQV